MFFCFVLALLFIFSPSLRASDDRFGWHRWQNRVEIKFPGVFGFLCLVSLLGQATGSCGGIACIFLYIVLWHVFSRKRGSSGFCAGDTIEPLLRTYQPAILYLSTLPCLGCVYSIPETLNWKQKAGDRLAS